MMRLTGRILLTVPLAIVALSCTRIPQVGVLGEEGAIGVDSLAYSDSIPLEWGNLIAVSPPPVGTTVYLLWFQDDGGVIRSVAYNQFSKRVLDPAGVIGRN
jgi:hypothetical protein